MLMSTILTKSSGSLVHPWLLILNITLYCLTSDLKGCVPSRMIMKRKVNMQICINVNSRFIIWPWLIPVVINDQLVQEAMLPGLRCLKQDMAVVAPEREEVVSSIIKDYETKVEGIRWEKQGLWIEWKYTK